MKQQVLSCTGAQNEDELKGLLKEKANKVKRKIAEGASRLKDGEPGRVEMGDDGFQTTEFVQEDREEDVDTEEQTIDDGSSILSDFWNIASTGVQKGYGYLRTAVWGNSRGGYTEVSGSNGHRNTVDHGNTGGGYQGGDVYTIPQMPESPVDDVKDEGVFIIADDRTNAKTTGDELDEMLARYEK